MRVDIKRITGIDDAIVAMYISKRSWTSELDDDIRDTCDSVLSKRGRPYLCQDSEELNKFTSWVNLLAKWGWKHTTMLRYINIQLMTDGIHRAGQD